MSRKSVGNVVKLSFGFHDRIFWANGIVDNGAGSIPLYHTLPPYYFSVFIPDHSVDVIRYNGPESNYNLYQLDRIVGYRDSLI